MTKTLMALAIALTLGFVSCKPKDADVKTNVETALKANTDASAVTVGVDKGVATLTGVVKDEATKTAIETATKAAKGVSSVVNNLTVTPAVVETPVVPSSVAQVLDAATQQKVTDGLKDIKGVIVTFVEDKAVLAGEVTAANRMKIMQILAAAKVKSDVSKLINKK